MKTAGGEGVTFTAFLFFVAVPHFKDIKMGKWGGGRGFH